MHPRLDPAQTAPGLRAVMTGLEHYVHQGGLEPTFSSSSNCARRSSMAAHTTPTCTRRSRVRSAKPSSGCTS